MSVHRVGEHVCVCNNDCITLQGRIDVVILSVHKQVCEKQRADTDRKIEERKAGENRINGPKPWVFID